MEPNCPYYHGALKKERLNLHHTACRSRAQAQSWFSQLPGPPHSYCPDFQVLTPEPPQPNPDPPEPPRSRGGNCTPQPFIPAMGPVTLAGSPKPICDCGLDILSMTAPPSALPHTQPQHPLGPACQAGHSHSGKAWRLQGGASRGTRPGRWAPPRTSPPVRGLQTQGAVSGPTSKALLE